VGFLAALPSSFGSTSYNENHASSLFTLKVVFPRSNRENAWIGIHEGVSSFSLTYLLMPPLQAFSKAQCLPNFVSVIAGFVRCDLTLSSLGHSFFSSRPV
jgi:hypothetical protein